MLSVKELRRLGASLSAEKFQRQLGPFALIQRPPGEAGSDLATTRMAAPEHISQGMVSLIFEFEELLVATLPPLAEVDELTVGRRADCDLVIDDPSVSKQHAILRWSRPEGRCALRDLGSTNGTFLNATTLGQREVRLQDGDLLSFGNVQFWYLLTQTLHARLRGGAPGGSPLRNG